MARTGDEAAGPQQPKEDEPQALAVPGEYAFPLHEWARENAWRIVDGERVAALELMGGFVHRMTQAGRAADYPSNYQRDWQAFLAS